MNRRSISNILRSKDRSKSMASLLRYSLIGALVYVAKSATGISWAGTCLALSSVALASLGLLYQYQDHLLYQPNAIPGCRKPSQNPPMYRSPAEYNMYVIVAMLSMTNAKLLSEVVLRTAA
jgi:hypothetical protein